MTVRTRKRPALPDVPTDVSPAVFDFLSAVKERLELDENERPNQDIGDAKPTVQDLIDAGMANAENILR